MRFIGMRHWRSHISYGLCLVVVLWKSRLVDRKWDLVARLVLLCPMPFTIFDQFFAEETTAFLPTKTYAENVTHHQQAFQIYLHGAT